MPVDYAALAQQARGTAPPVDYAALAAQARGQAAPAPERTFLDSVKDAGSAFWDWTGKPVAYALGLSGGTDAERGDKAREAQKQIVQGIMNEPGRIRQELTNSLDAFVAGNGRATMHHALNAIPLLGPGIDQASQEFNQGQYAKGVGHTGALLAPAAAKELPAITGAVGDATRAMATGAKEVIGSYLPERSAPVATSSTMGATAANIATNPITRVAANAVLPGSGKVINLMGRAKQVYDAFKGAPEAPPPAELPPGFGLSNGTTSGPIPAGAPRPVGTQPPVSGALPGPVVEAGPMRTGPIDVGPDTRGGPSLAQQLQAEMAARAQPTVEQSLTPGQILARNSGANWAKLTPADQAMLEHVAKAQANAAAQPQATPAAPAVPQAAPVEAPSAPIQQIDQAAPVEAPPEPPRAGDARSAYHANGERKSPQFRASEITNGNIDAKAERWATALHDAGLTAEDVRNIPGGKVGPEGLQKGEMYGWGDVLDHLVSKGKLPQGERVPNQSMPAIVGKLKQMDAARDWLEGPTALDGIVAGPITEVQQPVAPGSGTPAQSGVQAFPSRSSSMSDRMPDPVKDTPADAPVARSKAKPNGKTQATPEAPVSAVQPNGYQPDLVTHGMMRYDANLYEMVHSGDASSFGVVNKTYSPVLRTDTTSAATRATYQSLLDARKKRLFPETIRGLQKKFDNLLNADRQSFADKAAAAKRR